RLGAPAARSPPGHLASPKDPDGCNGPARPRERGFRRPVRIRTRAAGRHRIASSVRPTLRGEDRQDKRGDDSGGAGHEESGDDVVEQLREELEAARRRVREAWARYQREARDPKLPAIATSPLLPALMALLQQHS